MKTQYREDRRGYVSAPDAVVFVSVGDTIVESLVSDLKDSLKKSKLSYKAIHGTWLDSERTQKCSVFPVLRPKTKAAVVGMRARGYDVAEGVGYSFSNQGWAVDVAREVEALGVGLDELELEWMMGPKVAPKPQQLPLNLSTQESIQELLNEPCPF
jgi:hypothetical protein